MTPLPEPNRRLVSLSTAAATVGVTKRTIYNWIAAGKVEVLRTAGGNIRVYEDSLWREGSRDGQV